MTFRLGAIDIDEQAMTVTCNGTLVPVQRRVFDLIVYLIKHRDRVVTNEELLQEVWGGLAVTRASIAHSAMKARRALGDTGRSPSLITSVRGRGLRFIGTVEEVAGGTQRSVPPAADRISSFSSATESVFQLAAQLTAAELQELLPFDFLVIPQRQLVRGNPWALETAKAEEGTTEDGSTEGTIPRSIEVFDLWAPPAGCLTIGRARACNIVIRQQSVSKTHAKLAIEPTLMIEDLSSQNGTRVNGTRIRGAVAIQSGDTLHFGDVLAYLLSASALHAFIARRT